MDIDMDSPPSPPTFYLIGKEKDDGTEKGQQEAMERASLFNLALTPSDRPIAPHVSVENTSVLASLPGNVADKILYELNDTYALSQLADSSKGSTYDNVRIAPIPMKEMIGLLVDSGGSAALLQEEKGRPLTQ